MAIPVGAAPAIWGGKLKRSPGIGGAKDAWRWPFYAVNHPWTRS
jgi:hypothetical protein